jgi:hypothetical protein
MKLLLEYIRNWFINRPVAETEKSEENFYLIN